AITLIADGQLFYRGHNVLTLAMDARFEQVALLLWREDTALHQLPPMPAMTFVPGPLPAALARSMAELVSQGHVAEALQLALICVAPHDLAAYSTSPPAVQQTGLRLLDLLTTLFEYAATVSNTKQEPTPMPAQAHTGELTIAQRLQQSWLPTRPALAPLFDRALILCADHELNASSFTARCVASTGATPYAAIVAALAALQGYRHGGSTLEVAALFHEAKEDPEWAVRARLRQGKIVPGFGHRLYPEGDPRAKLLLQTVQEVVGDGTRQGERNQGAAVLKTAEALITITSQATGLYPNLDFGLVLLAQALELPEHVPFSLFALGRTAGWIGHLIEQYRLDQLIRPRALYTGLRPQQG
ncbi:MAG: hypothetical protein KDE53_29365, partial [Caldilineaceae bacterium]|nr:hypothetical protein [Caldilineaceae bacterium]